MPIVVGVSRAHIKMKITRVSGVAFSRFNQILYDCVSIAESESS